MDTMYPEYLGTVGPFGFPHKGLLKSCIYEGLYCFPIQRYGYGKSSREFAFWGAGSYLDSLQ